MPEQYASDKKTVGQLLSGTGPNIEVPEWQRSYTWDGEVEMFWQDLRTFCDRHADEGLIGQEYFLGSIVLVDHADNYELLDGQQRLATATILLSVIRDYLSQYKRDAAVRTTDKHISEFDDATDERTFYLTLNLYDREFFRGEVQEERGPNDSPPSATMACHKLIRKARQFFANRFDEEYETLGGGEAAFTWALRMRRTLTDHVSVVAVTSRDENSAAGVFETLNDRGVGLSTPDLLRNLLLRQAPATDRLEIVECWREILELGDDPKVRDFLRHYWVSCEGDVKSRSLYREMKQTILDRHIPPLRLSRDLRGGATAYLEITAARDEAPELQALLQGVEMLRAKPLLPAILSAYALDAAVEDRRRFVRALLALYVRHNVIGNLETSRLEDVVFAVARELRADRDLDAAIGKLKHAAPSDEQFTESFRFAEAAWVPTARYILRELEGARRRTAELEVAAAERVHVEHVYPRRPDEAWPDHEAVVNRLGNLTLLAAPLNQSIKNSDFTIKKAAYADSDLLLTRELLEFETWHAEAIDRRQARMSQDCCAIWGFPQAE